MSYNPNFYKDFHGNNFTFQTNYIHPPPALPASFIPSQPPPPYISDQEFVNRFKVNPPLKTCEVALTSITDMKEKLHNLIILLNNVKHKEKFLSDNVSNLSNEEWNSTLEEIKQNRSLITEYMAPIIDSYLGLLRKLLAKRSAKRMRLKRLLLERKVEKEERLRELQERSRKIDEKLQQIKFDINKTKQEEEAKLQADIILKEVLRKKHDAKKCVVKIEALMKLRIARQNTAKGRGESVSEKDAATFISNLEKLKSLWLTKLVSYEKEESDLRAQLTQDTEEQALESERDVEALENLANWREFLFGCKDGTPQVDFGGDVEKFVAVRSQWDQFLSNEGTPLPVGWVVPHLSP